MGKNGQRETTQIDLVKLARYYLEKLWLILICGLVLGAMAFGYTKFLVTPLYRADVTVYVNSAKHTQGIEYVTGGTLDAAQQLVSTYVSMLRSNTVLEKVIKESHLKETPDQIRSIMSASQVDETEIFKVSIMHPNPKLAAQIANAIAHVAPEMIAEFVDGSSTKIIDYADIPDKPAYPSVGRNTLLGAVLGCLLALVLLTVRFLYDFRIQDETDIDRFFDIPVLGSIPTFHHTGGKRYFREGYGEEERMNGYYGKSRG